MLCLHNAWGIFRKFSWLYYLYLQIWNWWVLYIHETFLVYKLETFKNCKEVKHIMISAIIYIFFILCDIWSIVENYFQKILSPLKKSTPPFLLVFPLKIQKVTPFLPKPKIFQAPPAERGEDTVAKWYICALFQNRIEFSPMIRRHIVATKIPRGKIFIIYSMTF